MKEELASALLELTAESNADIINLEREELTCGLIMLTEELYVEEERFLTLTAERDLCYKAHCVVDAESRNWTQKRRRLMWL